MCGGLASPKAQVNKHGYATSVQSLCVCVVCCRQVFMPPLSCSWWVGRAEMSVLASGTHEHPGTSSWWRQPSLAPLRPQAPHPQGCAPHEKCRIIGVDEKAPVSWASLLRCYLSADKFMCTNVKTFFKWIYSEVCAIWDASRKRCPWKPKLCSVGSREQGQLPPQGRLLIGLIVWPSFTPLTSPLPCCTVFLSPPVSLCKSHHPVLHSQSFHNWNFPPPASATPESLSPSVFLSISHAHPSLFIWETAEGSIGGRSLSSLRPAQIYYSLKHSHSNGPLVGWVVQLLLYTHTCPRPHTPSWHRCQMLMHYHITVQAHSTQGPYTHNIMHVMNSYILDAHMGV